MHFIHVFAQAIVEDHARLQRAQVAAERGISLEAQSEPFVMVAQKDEEGRKGLGSIAGVVKKELKLPKPTKILRNRFIGIALEILLPLVVWFLLIGRFTSSLSRAPPSTTLSSLSTPSNAHTIATTLPSTNEMAIETFQCRLSASHNSDYFSNNHSSSTTLQVVHLSRPSVNSFLGRTLPASSCTLSSAHNTYYCQTPKGTGNELDGLEEVLKMRGNESVGGAGSWRARQEGRMVQRVMVCASRLEGDETEVTQSVVDADDPRGRSS